MPQFESQQESLFKNRLIASAEQVSSFIHARKSEVRLMANLEVVRSMDWQAMKPIFLSRLEASEDEFEKFVVGLPNSHFYSTITENPYQNGISTFDDSDPNAQPKTIVKRDYWRTTIRNNTNHKQVDYVSNPMIAYTSGVKQIMVASSIHKDNKVVGLLGGTIDWKIIIKLIRSLESHYPDGSSSRYMLISKDGNYWYHWDQNRVIQAVTSSDGDFVKNDIGETSVQLFNILAEDSEQLKSIGRNMVAGKAGKGTALIEGEKNEVFFTPIKNTNYSLALVVKHQYYHAPMNQLLIYLLVAFIAGMLVYLFCVYLIPRTPKHK